MKTEERSDNPEVRRALDDLRSRTAASLHRFNSSVPYASWPRRSEIERLTSDLLRATGRAPGKRQSIAYEAIKSTCTWINRVGAVSLMRTGLRISGIGDGYAANWRHSARAAERFSLNPDRRGKCRSRVKWLWIEAWAEANFCKVLISRKRAMPSSLRRNG